MKGGSVLRAWSSLLVPVLFLLFAGAGVALTLRLVGGLGSGNRGAGVPVPSSYGNLPAYTKITRQHVDVIRMEKGKIPEGVLTNVKDVLGRVLARDKERGYVFTEKDFLPKGTREGLVAGIPPGRRAFALETDKVQGLYGLEVGDRVDLLGLFKSSQPKGQGVAGLVAGTAAAGSFAQSVPLVRDGIVVVPLRTRQVAYTQQSLTQGANTRRRSIQETVIAIAPGEAQAVVQALGMQAELVAVPRSGQPDASEGEAEPVHSGLHIVETISGDERSQVAVPRGKESASQ